MEYCSFFTDDIVEVKDTAYQVLLPCDWSVSHFCEHAI